MQRGQPPLQALLGVPSLVLTQPLSPSSFLFQPQDTQGSLARVGAGTKGRCDHGLCCHFQTKSDFKNKVAEVSHVHPLSLPHWTEAWGAQDAAPWQEIPTVGSKWPREVPQGCAWLTDRLREAVICGPGWRAAGLPAPCGRRSACWFPRAPSRARGRRPGLWSGRSLARYAARATVARCAPVCAR